MGTGNEHKGLAVAVADGLLHSLNRDGLVQEGKSVFCGCGSGVQV